MSVGVLPHCLMLTGFSDVRVERARRVGHSSRRESDAMEIMLKSANLQRAMHEETSFWRAEVRSLSSGYVRSSSFEKSC